jgi:predicted nucleotidyltransferase
MDDVVVFDRHDPMLGWSRDAFEEKLRVLLRGRVEEAWVFGSYAAGTMHAGSDVDLMLVQPTAIPFVRRAFQFVDLLDIGPAMDILVYTPEEFAHLRRNPTIGFWQTAVQQLRRLL